MPGFAHSYLLLPTAPLVFGTGKPLDFGLGGDTLAFPFPSTVAGALRAAAQVKKGQAADAYADAGNVALGPVLLARLGRDLALKTLLLPRPADAVYIGGHVVPLRAVDMPADQWTDLPRGLQLLELNATSADTDAKPDPAPPWWTAGEYARWLADAKETKQGEPGGYAGDRGPKEAPRTHVVIDPFGKGAKEGQLFRSTGMDYGPTEDCGGYALVVMCEQNDLDGLARRLGGEGRFVRFKAIDNLPLPAKPRALADIKHVRFVLVTPAIFPQGGWRPCWLEEDEDAHGNAVLKGTVPGTKVVVRLRAAAIARAQSYSGWQRDAAGNVGPGRPWRAVPAGSVYWFDIENGRADELWLRSLCQDNWLRDGWGYGIVGLDRPGSASARRGNT